MKRATSYPVHSPGIVLATPHETVCTKENAVLRVRACDDALYLNMETGISGSLDFSSSSVLVTPEEAAQVVRFIADWLVTKETPVETIVAETQRQIAGAA